jgi:hypothetical protein
MNGNSDGCIKFLRAPYYQPEHLTVHELPCLGRSIWASCGCSSCLGLQRQYSKRIQYLHFPGRTELVRADVESETCRRVR